MLEPAHIRMARAALGWRLSDLAERAEINLNTISRYEAGKDVLTGTLARIEQVLSDAGVIFLFEEDGQGIGVRLISGRAKERAGLRARKERQSKK